MFDSRASVISRGVRSFRPRDLCARRLAVATTRTSRDGTYGPTNLFGSTRAAHAFLHFSLLSHRMTRSNSMLDRACVQTPHSCPDVGQKFIMGREGERKRTSFVDASRRRVSALGSSGLRVLVVLGSGNRPTTFFRLSLSTSNPTERSSFAALVRATTRRALRNDDTTLRTPQL